MKALVTGDFILDKHILKGNRFSTSSSDTLKGTRIEELVGGANLTFEFLNKLLQFEFEKADFLISKNKKEIENLKNEKNDPSEKVNEKIDRLSKEIDLLNDRLSITAESNLIDIKFKEYLTGQAQFISYVDWNFDQKNKKWNHKEMGYGSFMHRTNEDKPVSNKVENDLTFLEDKYSDAGIIIIDEANLGFRNQDLKFNNKTILLKMAYPFCEGNNWKSLQGGGNKIYTIVTLENLRRYDVKVSKAISWEQTALDLCFEITRNEKLKGLLKSNYLIVLIGSAGALCIKPDPIEENTSFELIFDPGHMEDEWDQSTETLLVQEVLLRQAFLINLSWPFKSNCIRNKNSNQIYQIILLPD